MQDPNFKWCIQVGSRPRDFSGGEKVRRIIFPFSSVLERILRRSRPEAFDLSRLSVRHLRLLSKTGMHDTFVLYLHIMSNKYNKSNQYIIKYNINDYFNIYNIYDTNYIYIYIYDKNQISDNDDICVCL